MNGVNIENIKDKERKSKQNESKRSEGSHQQGFLGGREYCVHSFI